MRPAVNAPVQTGVRRLDVADHEVVRRRRAYRVARKLGRYVESVEDLAQLARASDVPRESGRRVRVAAQRQLVAGERRRVVRNHGQLSFARCAHQWRRPVSADADWPARRRHARRSPVTRSTQPCIPPGSLNRVLVLIGWGEGGNVTSAWWQVTPCDPIWHVSSRSDAVFVAQTAIRFLTLAYLTFIIIIIIMYTQSWTLHDQHVTVVGHLSTALGQVHRRCQVLPTHRPTTVGYLNIGVRWVYSINSRSQSLVWSLKNSTVD